MSTGTITIPAANVTLSDGSTLAIGAGSLPVTYTAAGGGGGGGGGGLATPPGYTSAQLYRDDSFASFDPSFWVRGWAGPGGSLWQPSPVSGTDSAGGVAGGFNAEYSAVSQVGFGSNGLTLTATPNSKYSPYQWVSGAMTSLWTTPAGKTTYIQFLAQMPDMTYGAWPAFWALKNNGPTELDGFEGSFNESGGPINNAIATTVHYSSSGQHQLQVNSGVGLTAAYHVYAFEHAAGSFKFWLDGNLLASITANVPATGGFNLMIDLAMGQNRNWGTVSDLNHPGPFVMSVKQMQIYTK